MQHEGPYLLGGYSFGGNVAFEIALLLEANGERVDQVVMCDSHPPKAYVGGSVSESGYLDAFPHLLSSLVGDVVIPPGTRISSITEALELIRPSISESMIRELGEFFEVWRQNHQALKRYFPDDRLRADVTMVAASQPENPNLLRLLGIRDLSLDHWREHIAGHITVVAVPGDHYSMFRQPEHLGVMAARFDRVMRRITGDSGPAPRDLAHCSPAVGK